ncbi:MAG: energy transducer TonB [Ignavibacteriales bacterium]|nr:energy transducer TonB [Ignavibacteriales bacterium]
MAKRAGVEGKVYVLAFVDEAGNVTRAKIIKGIGAGCDEAALDAVRQTKFKPGKQRGTPVKVQVSIPIVFKTAIRWIHGSSMLSRENIEYDPSKLGYLLN